MSSYLLDAYLFMDQIVLTSSMISDLTKINIGIVSFHILPKHGIIYLTNFIIALPLVISNI